MSKNFFIESSPSYSLMTGRFRAPLVIHETRMSFTMVYFDREIILVAAYWQLYSHMMRMSFDASLVLRQ